MEDAPDVQQGGMIHTYKKSSVTATGTWEQRTATEKHPKREPCFNE